ncbi:MAG: cupin domain-containing protein, partial [Anaerolineaceae bacterium]|nr:cupin domain-containing protein [Anaerolineaceae bacterium]
HLVDTDGLTISFLRMEKHSAFEVHSHVQEQIMIVTKGNCDEIIDGKCYHVKKGDVIRLPSDVPHGAFINEEDCYAIDLFIGGRPDYIQKFYQQNSEAVLPYR